MLSDKKALDVVEDKLTNTMRKGETRRRFSKSYITYWKIWKPYKNL